MAGNVWEWCADWYGADSYKNAPAKNPTGADTGTGRALRGASWYNGAPSGLRVSYRHNKDPMGRNGSIGFRCVVRSPGP
jgi:formylglycine-generating enzyme required for sulfatase activity